MYVCMYVCNNVSYIIFGYRFETVLWRFASPFLRVIQRFLFCPSFFTLCQSNYHDCDDLLNKFYRAFSDLFCFFISSPLCTIVNSNAIRLVCPRTCQYHAIFSGKGRSLYLRCPTRISPKQVTEIFKSGYKKVCKCIVYIIFSNGF